MPGIDPTFELFGDKATFALEVRHTPDRTGDAEPEDWKGSWGEWRLWVSGLNLCQMSLTAAGKSIEVEEVRWFLAPLFKWLASNWMPLLHERRMPQGGRVGDGRPRWARAAYRSTVESAGHDLERFEPWQHWATRHSLRTASEGGNLPDVFVQRLEDDLEFSWGDCLEPGAGVATIPVEDGVARASVDEVASSLSSAVDWFLEKHDANSAQWVSELQESWNQMKRSDAGIPALSWYLDSSPEPKALTKKLLSALESFKRPQPSVQGQWLGSLSPEVAMFGDLSPNMSDKAIVTLMAEYFRAYSNSGECDELTELMSEVPAWAAPSPWHNGYALALDLLEDFDPKPAASMTHIELILAKLGVQVRRVNLGKDGPRGVALAGGEVRTTILVNKDDVRNTTRGTRFTLAHELCHILHDRSHARALAHSSTPWASPTVEQRANAFAAMLLMPPTRVRLKPCQDLSELKREVSRLADRLKVSRGALRRHLANIGEIGADKLALLLGNQSQEV